MVRDRPIDAVSNRFIETARPEPSNHDVASVLSEIADLLESQGAIRFRVEAYRRAAMTVAQLDQSIASRLANEGIEGLIAIPTIGQAIAKVISQTVCTGTSATLQRLRGENVCERIFATVPEIGPRLARRIHETLQIETLPELLSAAHDGRLARVEGMGEKRIRAVRESLTSRIVGHHSPVALRKSTPVERTTPISELLDIDDEYMRLNRSGKLRKIAPRQFNPGGVAWLPIMHTEREDRHYTALHSNTARAHELNTIHDWVVIYRDDDHATAQWTVITSQYGPLKGRRIIRGREEQCAEFYRSRE